MGSNLFLAELARLTSECDLTRPRQWQFIPYDQLNGCFGLLNTHAPQDVGIVLCETSWKPAQRPYHQQKLALLLSSQRHFALEQAKRGVHVRYVFDTRSYAEVLRELISELGPMVVCRPAERELRTLFSPLIDDGALVEIEHPGWFTKNSDFQMAFKGKATWLMDTFYRFVRKKYDVLLDEKGKPIGGKWSHDADNRKPWKGTPQAPTPPTFEVHPITQEVCELVQQKFAEHPGQVKPSRIAATLNQVERYWSWVLRACMENFGPFEDAMHTDSRQLFHTRISGLLNLHRLMPHRVVNDVVQLDIPINSKEGFVRQVIGWREYVHHVHETTDGFRNLSNTPKHSLRERLEQNCAGGVTDARPLPNVYWGQTSGLQCLDHVVQEVMEDAHTHHINRLMILANWGSLLNVSPRELSDWFWVAFDDAYDWVVEPNVLGMGTFALEALMVTKPYVSGSGYVNRMSNYCDGCAFDPKKNCPMTPLYWAFLARNDGLLSSNARMNIVRASLAKRGDDSKAKDHRTFEVLSGLLQEGKRITPAVLYELVESL